MFRGYLSVESIKDIYYKSRVYLPRCSASQEECCVAEKAPSSSPPPHEALSRGSGWGDIWIYILVLILALCVFDSCATHNATANNSLLAHKLHVSVFISSENNRIQRTI